MINFKAYIEWYQRKHAGFFYQNSATDINIWKNNRRLLFEFLSSAYFPKMNAVYYEQIINKKLWKKNLT